MIRWGINALNHGSSLAVFNDNKLVSNVTSISDSLPRDSINRSIDLNGPPDEIYWYENPWTKKARQLYASQWSRAFDLDALPKRYLREQGLHYAPVTYTPHHASHAAAGYYTSPFNHCAVVVIDAIGEWDCVSIWEGEHGNLTKLWSRSYPHSLGLFYSAFTQLIGLTPVKDEYLLQQMASIGNPSRYYNDVRQYFSGVAHLEKNLHKGVIDWPHKIKNDFDRRDIAAAVQLVFEEQISLVMTIAKSMTGSDSLVYMGGCAMNSAANKRVVESKWNYIWSLSNPGDPSSAMGAVLYHTKQRIVLQDNLAKHIRIKV